MVEASRANVPDAKTVYDATGKRVATKVNDIWQFVIYDAFGNLVAEYGGLSTDEGGIKYYLQDYQASPRATLNSVGYILSRTDFTSFGEEVNSGIGTRTATQGFIGGSNIKQGYGSTENDEASGLGHTWFRKLENQAGRWTSPDPYNGSMNLGNPQSFNRYSYVENEPTNFVDPSGLQAEEPANGEACDYRVIGSDGLPIYLGTYRNGVCVPNVGSPVIVYGETIQILIPGGDTGRRTPDEIDIDGGGRQDSALAFDSPISLHKQDKWYGYNNKDFHKWFHRCWKRPRDSDASKSDIEEVFLNGYLGGS